eukprot:555578-Pleurochrysis_carterae.AAC.1
MDDYRGLWRQGERVGRQEARKVEGRTERLRVGERGEKEERKRREGRTRQKDPVRKRSTTEQLERVEGRGVRQRGRQRGFGASDQEARA